jgi:hypothetical protein
MRIRLLVSAAALAAALVIPSGAFAATVTVNSAPYATPVDLSWNVTASVSEVLYRAPGACAVLPMPGEVPIDTDAGAPPTGTTFSDAPGDGVFCYYVRDDAVGLYSNAVTATVDTTNPTGSVTSPALATSTTGAIVVSASDATSGVGSVAFERSDDAGATWSPMTSDSSPPYTADWDTTDGDYLVHGIVTDLAGRSFQTPDASLEVDTTQPAVTMTAPAGSSTVHGSAVTVSAHATDAGTGVTGVVFEAKTGAGSFQSIGSGVLVGGDYTMTWDTTGLNGSYTIHAIATDGATHSRTSLDVTGVLVDNTAPAVSVTAPAPSSTVHGTTVSLTANASDGGSGVLSVVFEVLPPGSGSWTQVGSPVAGPTGPYGVTWNTTSTADGTYSVRATATDNATHSTISLAVGSVLVDNTAPSVTLTAPTAAQMVGGTAVTVSATADDGTLGSGISSVDFEYQLVGAGSWSPIASDATFPYGVSWNTTLLPADGLYNVRATSHDRATHASTPVSVGSVMVDNTAPPAPSPAPTGLSPVASGPSITFNHAIDPTSGGVHSGTDHYDVYRGLSLGTVALVQTVVDDGSPSFTWIDSGLAVPPSPQNYIYVVKAVDKTGNTSAASGSLTILVDGTGQSSPTNVTAQATPTNQAPQISWVPPTGYPVDHYKVYRNSVFLANVVISQTSFTDTGVAPGTYSYQVRAAQDAAPETLPLGVVSAAVSVVYDTAPPSAPVGPAASAALDGSIAISWSAASDGAGGSGVTRYIVRRALSSIAPATATDGDAVCQGLVSSCTDATAINGKLYSYAVFAVDAAGNTSAAGNTLAVTARDQLAPAVPSGLAATPGNATVGLSWTAAATSDDVAGYVLVAKPGTIAPSSDTDGTRVCSTIVATSTACAATGLTNGAAYTFGLFALDEALNRSAAAVVTAVPNGPVTDAKAPAAVKALSAKIAGHTVTLTWKNPADKDFDHVEITASDRKPASKKAAKRVYSGKGTKATTTLAAGQSRWFTVVAYDRVGNASQPATVHVTVAAASPFGPAPRATVHGKVQLHWPVVKGAKYYNVQLYAGKKRILVSWPAGHAVRLPKAKLKRGTKYTWYVWPGLGAKAKAHYGKLIGKNVFTYAG